MTEKHPSHFLLMSMWMPSGVRVRFPPAEAISVSPRVYQSRSFTNQNRRGRDELYERHHEARWLPALVL